MKISIIFGTRPEAIKLAPIILELKKYPSIEVNVCVTAQHREMLDQVLEIFSIEPDVDLNLMQKNQTLSSLTSRAIETISSYLEDYKPDWIMVQGDTTTVLAASIAAFYNKVKILHIEAGLRTNEKYSPFPEEMNRKLTTHLADIHFAPTKLNKRNLISEGVSEDKIFVVGNTVIDALFLALEKIKKNPPVFDELPGKSLEFMGERKLVLITGHRRENFGTAFENICYAIRELSEKFSDVDFIYPVHLNPNVQEPVTKILSESKNRNIYLIKPLQYLQFVALMNRSTVILTDSGGIQEEAPSISKMVFVTRESTERPEGIQTGLIKIVGSNQAAIVSGVSEYLIRNSLTYPSSKNPYGDGFARRKIIEILFKNI